MDYQAYLTWLNEIDDLSPEQRLETGRLLAATYNPTDWNYVSWTMVNFNGETAMMVLMGLLLMAGYIIYLGSIRISYASAFMIEH